MFESYSNLNTSLKYSKFQIITLFQNTVISPNFLVCEFCGKKSFSRVLSESFETLRELCVSTKFPNKEIKRHFGILGSVFYCCATYFDVILSVCFVDLWCDFCRQISNINSSIITLLEILGTQGRAKSPFRSFQDQLCLKSS